MSTNFRIALLIESSRMYGRELLRGIAAFGRERGDWTFFHEERSLGDEMPPRLTSWRPHGILARLAGSRLARQIREMQVPVVDLFHEDETKDIPGVSGDQDAMVRMAVSHFVERGFRNFAYCGFAQALFSEMRETSFIRQLAEQGYEAHLFRYPPLPEKPEGFAAIESHAALHSAELAAWLRELPKPAALFACNDIRGQQVLDVCVEAGIAVPDEVAVLGVDNDDILCELTEPPISSIDPNGQAIGYKAASVLQRLLDGGHVPAERFVVAPLGIVTRRSTDVLAIADQAVAEAVRIVREHAFDGTNARAMLEKTGLSRSTLDRWFQRCLGHSVKDEIIRLRINRVAELLVTTNVKIETIAHQSGFTHVESMTRIFERVKGSTPGRYRLRFSNLTVSRNSSIAE